MRGWRRGEYLAAAVWAMFGLVVLVASWRIDRLENLGINPWSIPGLLPGVIGVLIFVLAIALAWQTRHATVPAEGPAATPAPVGPAGSARPAAAAAPATVSGTAASTASDAPEETAREWLRTLAAATLCVLFAGVSLGRGLPFMAEAAAFIFLFISAFSWSRWRADDRVLRGLASTLAIAVAAALLISWLFESVFLVRLP